MTVWWDSSRGEFIDDFEPACRAYVGTGGRSEAVKEESAKRAALREQTRLGLREPRQLAEIGDLPERVARLHEAGVLYTDIDRRARVVVSTVNHMMQMARRGGRKMLKANRDAIEAAVEALEMEVRCKR